MTYDFRVSAINASGTSSASSIVSGTAAWAAVPEPQFILPFEGNYNDSSSRGFHGISSGVSIVTDGTR